MKITIPPEAWAAGADIIRHARGLNNPDPENVARAAFTAMVRAWPGMANEKNGTKVLWGATSHLILPLQESSDE